MQIILIVVAVLGIGILLHLRKKEQSGKTVAPAESKRQAADKKSDKTKAVKASKANKNQEANQQSKAEPAVSPAAEAQAEQAPASLADLHEIDTAQPVKVSVQDVDPLTEYKVYKEFGYLDKAAESLRAYLDTQPNKDPDLLYELAEIYLGLENYEALVDLIHDSKAIFSQDQIEHLIKQGLEVDPNNLELRVLADELLHWDVDTINAEVLHTTNGNEPIQTSNANNGVLAEPFATDELLGAGAVSGAEGRDLSFNQADKLITGHGLLRHVSDEELQVLSMMVPSDKAVKLMRRFADYGAFSYKLDQVLPQLKNPAAALIDVLGLDYQNKNSDAFVRHLWELYNVLGKHGQNIKDKMLAWGFSLGGHEALNRLALATSEQEIKEIGKEFGYRLSTQGKSEHVLPLVSDEVGVGFSKSLGRSVNSILQEADGYLMYGQLEEAMATLENGIKQHHDEPQLYVNLFELYERAENWTRLEEFSKKLRTNADSLPEEVILVMSQLTQKLKNNNIGMVA